MQQPKKGREIAAEREREGVTELSTNELTVKLEEKSNSSKKNFLSFATNENLSPIVS